MSESFQYGRVRGEDAQVFIGTGKILGLQSLEVASNFGLQPLLYLSQGNKQTFNISNSEQFAEVSINSLLINQDNFISLTGKDCCNIYILKDKNDVLNNNYFLISGYLNSYNASYAIGQIPQINAGFKFYNNAGKINSGELNVLSVSQLTGIQGKNYDFFNSGIRIPFFHSVYLTTTEGLNNRVTQFNISLDINRIPVYNIGNRQLRRADVQYPINADISITIESSPLYSGTALQNLPRDNQSQNINIIINDGTGNLNIANYSFNNIKLVNEQKSISIDGNELITKQYNCKLMD